MPGPTLTAGEEQAIAAAVAAIAAAQAARERPVQVREGDVDGLIALGVDPAAAAAAAERGFLPAVDVYEGPEGFGWTLRAHLERDGRWVYLHHVGAEEHRDAENGWHMLPQIGGA